MLEAIGPFSLLSFLNIIGPIVFINGRVCITASLLTPVITTSDIVAGDNVLGVRLDVCDDGPGIPEKIKNNLFSPFMTTKSHGHSGLGLSVVHKTTQELGGTIKCETTKEQGTRFTLSLPLNHSLTYSLGQI